MYQCFHCLQDAVCWDGDFSFEDYGMEGEGIVHVCHCSNYGADIEYYIRIDEEDVKEVETIKEMEDAIEEYCKEYCYNTKFYYGHYKDPDEAEKHLEQKCENCPLGKF